MGALCFTAHFCFKVNVRETKVFQQLLTIFRIFHVNVLNPTPGSYVKLAHVTTYHVILVLAVPWQTKVTYVKHAQQTLKVMGKTARSFLMMVGKKI